MSVNLVTSMPDEAEIIVVVDEGTMFSPSDLECLTQISTRHNSFIRVQSISGLLGQDASLVLAYALLRAGIPIFHTSAQPFLMADIAFLHANTEHLRVGTTPFGVLNESSSYVDPQTLDDQGFPQLMGITALMYGTETYYSAYPAQL